MFAVAALVAFVLALILHWVKGVSSNVVEDCVLFGFIFIAAHLAWPLGFGVFRRVPPA
jgi:hypothetical protein